MIRIASVSILYTALCEREGGEGRRERSMERKQGESRERESRERERERERENHYGMLCLIEVKQWEDNRSYGQSLVASEEIHQTTLSAKHTTRHIKPTT